MQDIRSGPNTYGHRFLTTSGRAGRAIKVKTFDDYQARLLENFVILDRARARVEDPPRARNARAASSADACQRPRRGALVAAAGSARPGRISVGRRRPFPGRVPPAARRSADDDDDSSSALLSGGGRRRQAEAGVPRRHQHAAGEAGDHRAQLRARADGAAARRAVLLGRGSQGDARVAHRSARRRSCSTRSSAATARRPIASRRWRRGSRARRSGSPRPPRRAEQAGRLCKADLATDMVRELTELQGTMGGIYAREEGQPEAVWKAIYLPLPAGRRRSRRAADAAAARRRGGDVGGGVARRQARLGRRHVRGRRAPDRLARSARPAPSGAGRGEDSGRPAGADRRRRHGSISGTCVAQALSSWAPSGESQQALRTFMRERVDLSVRAARLRRAEYPRRRPARRSSASTCSKRGGSSKRWRR